MGFVPTTRAIYFSERPPMVETSPFFSCGGSPCSFGILEGTTLPSWVVVSEKPAYPRSPSGEFDVVFVHQQVAFFGGRGESRRRPKGPENKEVGMAHARLGGLKPLI